MKYSKIISIFALLFMLSLTVFAFGNKSSNSDNGKGAANNSTSTMPSSGTSGSYGQGTNTGWRGPDAWTYRMSLEELDNWDFSGLTGDEYAAKIQEYGEHYYVVCQEEAYYGANKTTEPTKTIRNKTSFIRTLQIFQYSITS